jgi:hypothetical protein
MVGYGRGKDKLINALGTHLREGLDKEERALAKFGALQGQMAVKFHLIYAEKEKTKKLQGNLPL